MKKNTNKNRRQFIKESAALGAALSSSLMLSSCVTGHRTISRDDKGTYDFIIVGSGAGGGPLAARLARRGYHVLLLEAGQNPAEPQNPLEALTKIRVPAYHGISTEDPRWSWNYYVRHSSGRKAGTYDGQYEFDDRLDTKYVESKGGILYPRASALGGCTIHNAMITMVADPQDWEAIKELTGDDSWNKKAMAQLFIDRVENKRYSGSLIPSHENQGNFYENEGSWLSTEKPDPRLLFKDSNLRKLPIRNLLNNVFSGNKAFINPNANPISGRKEGAALTPQATHDGVRSSPRRWLLQTVEDTGGRLDIKTDYFVTQLSFKEGSSNEVQGVKGRFHEGRVNLYEASPRFDRSNIEKSFPFEFTAKNEVILAGGAFNSPQLLMLSGIGPRQELNRHNIPIRVDLPGVGKNLQDRYEIGVVSKFKRPSRSIKECTFAPENVDPCLDAYNNERDKKDHLYSSNGVIVGHVHKSEAAKREGGAADLFVFAAPGDFRGYKPNWSKEATATSDKFTWAILKGHTRNNEGYVKLKSKDPHETPEINFRNFAQGRQDDMAAMKEGITIARNLNSGGTLDNAIEEEIWPPKKDPATGRSLLNDKALEDFIMQEVWGHHASCTCKIGPENDEMAVLDSRFKVHGVKGLRVVDASSFPKIPGLFIVAPIYTISEKAADVITEDYPS